MVKIILISIILVLISPEVENKKELTCDSLRHQPFSEGNIGQTGIVPWVGVIRAHLHFRGSTNIAVSGAILIKPKHAIANADDMSKIRKQGDSKAMFISADRGPWTCKLGDVSVHPEYEFATYNTMALVELDTESLVGTAPMLPVCMASYLYNTSDQLYAIGFTDENKLLEKVAYKVAYVERELCDEFYKRAGHGMGMFTPAHYECAYAVNSDQNCEWENGMALVSNASGHWVLVGFGVQGPGCSAPARFIDVYSYTRWIESSSNVEDFDADYPFRVKVRRSDFESIHVHLKDVLNSTFNYSKSDRESINGTKVFSDVLNGNFFKSPHSSVNMTFREFLKQKEMETEALSVKEDNVTLDGIGGSNPKAQPLKNTSNTTYEISGVP